MDLQRAFAEANKRLRNLNEQMCCLTDAVAGGPYNTLNPVTIASGESFIILALGAHSVSWDIASGASLTISTDTGSATYSSNGSIEFSAVNTQEITFTAVGGEVRFLYII